MKRLIALPVLLQTLFFLQAQQKSKAPDLSKENYVITDLQKDTIKERDRASQTLRNLRNGSVIVRLKINQKSIEAYRKSGRNDIAEKIEVDRKKQNEKMYQAFKRNFLFCKVYFIYANETKEFKKGNNKIFLNANLEHDPTITLADTNFIFCEFGSVEQFSEFKDYEHPASASDGNYLNSRVRNNKKFDMPQTQTSTSPATSSGLFFLDKDLRQLHRPFPFVEGVYMENYDAPVRTLNREIERAYQRLVVMQDYKTEIKAQRKKEKQKRKAEPKYNPFK